MKVDRKLEFNQEDRYSVFNKMVVVYFKNLSETALRLTGKSKQGTDVF